MNFDLCLDRVRAGDLAAPFRDHPGGAFGPAYAERLALLPVDSQGFLTGSIDLVFRAPDAQGGQRWWVADWKSNWLGRRDSEGRPVACGPRHYGPDAMARLMATNHYPLQAHLYLVALHRYLSWRLTGYDPRRDLGGYVYVFLRGTPGAEAIRGLPGPVPGMFVEQPPLGRLPGPGRRSRAAAEPAGRGWPDERPDEAQSPEPPDWLPPLGGSLAEALPRLHHAPPDPLVGQLIVALSAALERGDLEVSLGGAAPDGVVADGWPGHLQALVNSPQPGPGRAPRRGWRSAALAPLADPTPGGAAGPGPPAGSLPTPGA